MESGSQVRLRQYWNRIVLAIGYYRYRSDGTRNVYNEYEYCIRINVAGLCSLKCSYTQVVYTTTSCLCCFMILITYQHCVFMFLS
jgi:hypothetical protein